MYKKKICTIALSIFIFIQCNSSTHLNSKSVVNVSLFKKLIPVVLINQYAINAKNCNIKFSETSPTIKNIALEGGGIWGTAYPGAFKILEKYGIYEQLENVAGTSAGAITALMVALNYSSDEMFKMMVNLDYSKIMSSGSLFRLQKKYGYYSNEFIKKFIEQIIINKFNRSNITFEELHNLKNNSYRNLYVFGTDLTRISLKVFSHIETPQVSIAKAVLVSISTPLALEAPVIDGKFYVDGGLMLNYPITYFSSIDPFLNNTIGIAFAKSMDTPENLKDHYFGYCSLGKYIKNLFLSMFSQSGFWSYNELIKNSTILINTNDIINTQYIITANQKDELYGQGLKAAKSYFECSNNSNILNSTLNFLDKKKEYYISDNYKKCTKNIFFASIILFLTLLCLSINIFCICKCFCKSIYNFNKYLRNKISKKKTKINKKYELIDKNLNQTEISLTKTKINKKLK